MYAVILVVISVIDVDVDVDVGMGIVISFVSFWRLLLWGYCCC